jgi:hypothetical protein
VTYGGVDELQEVLFHFYGVDDHLIVYFDYLDQGFCTFAGFDLIYFELNVAKIS